MLAEMEGGMAVAHGRRGVDLLLGLVEGIVDDVEQEELPLKAHRRSGAVRKLNAQTQQPMSHETTGDSKAVPSA